MADVSAHRKQAMADVSAHHALVSITSSRFIRRLHLRWFFYQNNVHPKRRYQVSQAREDFGTHMCMHTRQPHSYLDFLQQFTIRPGHVILCLCCSLHGLLQLPMLALELVERLLLISRLFV
jgi:hypothetical protein